MKIDIQATLINIIKDKIGADDSIGRSLAEVLNLSQDPVFRRTRGETSFFINWKEWKIYILIFIISSEFFFNS